MARISRQRMKEILDAALEQPSADRAAFLRRLDTPGRVIIELAPVEWITYDGVRLESSLRGITYDPDATKPSRNRQEPPPGRSPFTLD